MASNLNFTMGFTKDFQRQAKYLLSRACLNASYVIFHAATGRKK